MFFNFEYNNFVYKIFEKQDREENFLSHWILNLDQCRKFLNEHICTRAFLKTAKQLPVVYVVMFSLFS